MSSGKTLRLHKFSSPKIQTQFYNRSLAGSADENAGEGVDDSKAIRGLLGMRQDSRPSDYAVSNDGS